MIFASWCLTLFTISMQYNDKVELLDSILDIFIGKGWIGFLRVLLVMFEEMFPQLHNLD